MEKSGKSAFHPNLKQGVLCPVSRTAPAALHNIPSSCKVNAATMSIFIPLHHFYLRKLATNDPTRINLSVFLLKFSCLMK